ncbi:MAG TPA: hypothetical protein VFH02_12725 [Jiangellaceae bacterium]|nr:hypothetical protein [Jiangellaceae bacterium]
MIHLSKLAPALAAAVIGVLAAAPGAVAGPPAPQDLNPAPPDYYDCRPLGAVTICTASLHEEKVSEPQTELVCGTGADAFVIHDTGVIDQDLTRRYNADGDLIKRVIHEVWTEAFWSNPLSGKTVPYTQNGIITTVLAVPGDFDSATETTVGENVYTDPATHRKVLTTAGRTVFGADGTLESRAGQQPFLDAFVDGDMSVFDPICAALA